ncbi:ATP-dependent zinc metalloprotease YME1L1 isoform X1 [Anolis carolinensis]|uniref:ATP-dependent zinc metalloprotease YME1L1 isoform X1 n=1 Tax=Anolis carolinensis TaxID=28377 RepID=UPI00020398D1|nr:PREDICTED: ATP-dependent zinc metalloprotease YME1L1 isoform X1 [Anolis carolinensis]|eukprot:XP_003222128.1 PREDICTED: ATP-dependent zinc metalloprotease YME1L1 isoform X1 [Anolis carolinensis]
MFSFSTTVQPQVTVPLSHLINAFHSPKSLAPSFTATSSQCVQKEAVPESDVQNSEPILNLRDLGLSDLKASQLDELVDRLLPGYCIGNKTSSHWQTSYISSQSFFENKYGFADIFSTLRSSYLYRQHPSPLQSLCSDLQRWPVFIQSRGFKTLKSRARRLQSTSERLTETETVAPSFVKGLLLRDRGSEVESLEKLMKTKNIPEAHQDAFKTGFAEGFLKAQALTQRTNDSLRRTRLFLLILLLLGIYGLSKTPFLSGKGSFSDTVRFRTTSGLDAAVDPIQMKNVTFEHVKGVEEAKQELQEVVEFLKNPQKFTVLGGKLPKGILLVGPPGTGKTLLARAVAGEADVPFYYASGSEFDEMFVGVGASRIRNLFREAKANAPCVIFIDELDSVGGKRIESPMHPYSRQTINQLLAEMDGFKPNEGVIIIGATNFPEALDNALIRPGRFDMQVTVPRPDVKGRTEILKWYLNKIKYDESLDPEIIARGTVGFSGAELENLVNQAALKAAVDGKDMVTMKELEFSKDKILMGPERRSVEIDDRNKTITAYHESGHAIIAYYTKDAMPINKATIMPRGPTLGHVSLLPENDRWSETRSQLLAQMDVSMGGRVAEELIFGGDHITTGASSDFDNATKIAKLMVTKFGMSEKLGVMTYTDTGKLSPETQSAIEQEVRTLLKDSYERAKHLLKTHAKEHKNLAEALLTYETLDAKEIQIVLEGKKLEVR